MQVYIKKRENNPAVRIPAHLMNAVNFQQHQLVEIREEGGKLIIESLTQPVYILSELLEGKAADVELNDVKAKLKALLFKIGEIE